MIPSRLVFLDLETTGTRPPRDRILEIGLCEVVDGELQEEWSTLVDPGRPVSPFIEGLTGITAAQVAGAPTFGEIAEELASRLRGRVLVAHNARFDYGFLKSEFRRLGRPFEERTLCTVRLSRTLFPKHRSHNLDAVLERHGLAAQDRHRALGDARAVLAFFERLRADLPPETLAAAVARQLRQPSLPPGLPPGELDDLPAAPGVYLFYGENDTLLYVGKSVNLRSRVLSHFAGDHRTSRGMHLSRQVRRLEWQRTAGELGALLLEARLVKERSPIHNRRLRRTRELFALRLEPGREPEVPVLRVASLGEAGGEETGFGLFRARRQAEKALLEIVREQGLCRRLLGLEKGSGACFGHQIRQCRGACVGLEPPALHHARLLQALTLLGRQTWPFRGAIGIRERDPDGERTDLHVFDQWRHLGTAATDTELQEILADSTPLPFDLDGYRILARYLEGNPVDLLHLSRPVRTG